MLHRQGALARPREAARRQARELTSIGAVSKYTPSLPLLEATEPPVLPTATSLTTRGPLRGAEVITLVEGTPEAEATSASEAAAITGEDRLDAVGGGHRAAGRPRESYISKVYTVYF